MSGHKFGFLYLFVCISLLGARTQLVQEPDSGDFFRETNSELRDFSHEQILRDFVMKEAILGDFVMKKGL